SGAGTTTPPSASSFVFTPPFAGAYQVNVTAFGSDGTSASASQVFEVGAGALTAAIAGAPTHGQEGTAITLYDPLGNPNLTGPLTYAWAVCKDGSAYPTAPGDATGFFTFTPNDEGIYQAFLSVSD